MDVKRLSPLLRFTYWIQERENIRLLRLAGKPAPWTADEILRKYRFCNVRRMDDRVSQWLWHNWYRPNLDHPNMHIACALARFINLPASLSVIGFPNRWRPTEIKRKLHKYKSLGNQVFNGAYMVRGNDGMDKIECVVDYYVTPLACLRINELVDSDSMRNTWENIVQRYGFGSFMAGQVTADLRWGMTGVWSDRTTWAPLGPGSKRGMNRLHGASLRAPLTQGQFEQQLTELIAKASKFLPSRLVNRMEAMDWQNCLCEFDKYERTLFDGRRPKSLYRGGNP